MLSHSQEWSMTIQSIATINGVGVEQIRSGMKELEEAGYVKRKRARDANGKLGGSDWYVSDLPTSENPTLENPQLKKTIYKKTKVKTTQPAENQQAGTTQDSEAKASGDSKKPLQQRITEWVYDKTNGSINFKAVMGVVKHHLERNRDPKLVANACLALYEAGKPITNQTLGQAMDGKLYGVVVAARATPTKTSDLTVEEVNQILGPDNWAPPMPPAEVYGDVEAERAWRQEQIMRHQEERRHMALERINGN